MKVQVQSIHFDADVKLIHFIQRKINKLETFYDKLLVSEVYLRLNNQRIDNKTVEIKINVPGSQLFAKENARSFEAATEMATTALQMQLKKFKEKIRGRSDSSNA